MYTLKPNTFTTLYPSWRGSRIEYKIGMVFYYITLYDRLKGGVRCICNNIKLLGVPDWLSR